VWIYTQSNIKNWQRVVATSLISSARNKLLTSWWQQGCSNFYEQPVLVLLEKLVESLLRSSILKQSGNNLFETCHNNWEQAVQTHPDIGLTKTFVTTCLHICNNLRAFTFAVEFSLVKRVYHFRFQNAIDIGLRGYTYRKPRIKTPLSCYARPKCFLYNKYLVRNKVSWFLTGSYCKSKIIVPGSVF
jgi:hypothetical protein